MTALPTLKLRVLPTFPASVTGDGVVTVTKAAGVYTIGFNQSFSPTWTGAHTFNTTTGDAITITPRPASTNKALSVTQTSPTSGSVAGPLIYNVLNMTNQIAATGSGLSNGLNNTNIIGLRLNMTTGGPNITNGGSSPVSQTGTLQVLLRETIGPSSGGDMVAGVNFAYSNVTGGGGILAGATAESQCDTGCSRPYMEGLEAATGITGGTITQRRSGISIWNTGTSRAATLDAAITVTSNSLGGEYSKLIALSSVYTGATTAPLSTTGDFFFSENAITVANIFNLPNVTVTGNIANFPNLIISGAGTATFGSNTPAGYNLGTTISSGGSAGLNVSTNTTSGVNGVQGRTSNTNNIMVMYAVEPANTATAFGITTGNWGYINASGSSNNGILLGTNTAVPVVLGTNNLERARLLLGLMVGTTIDPGAGGINASTLVRSPLVVGGTATSSVLTLESTSGAGTTDSILFKTGSQVLAGFVNTSQQWLLGTSGNAPAANAVVTISKNAASPLAAVTALPLIHAVGTDSTQPAILLDSYAGANAGNQPFFVIRKARGTAAAATAVQANDALGYFGMVGANANGAFASEAAAAGGVFFGAVATQTWNLTQAGCELRLYTTPNGSTTVAQAVTVQQSGGLSVGSTTDGGIGTVLANVGFRVGANQVAGARITGYTAMTGSPDKATAYATGTVTLAQLAGRVAQLQADLTTHGLIGA